MTDWRIIEGDCRDVLRSLDADSAHTCVTSPPYFGLRDYGTDGQIGLEPTPDEFVAALVDVFREVRRVLRDDGTAWLNLGDSYAGGGRGGHEGGNIVGTAPQGVGNAYPRSFAGCKPKDLLGIPWMVAFALRADGWYLRSDIVWSKLNPMPESVTDRPTKAHEYVFLLSKGPRYFYDADAIREDAQYGFSATNGDMWRGVGSVDADPQRGGRTVTPGDGNGGRNKRSVWTVATQPYAGAHFATFPPKLIEPCILAGAPERACGECGAPWMRVVEKVPDGRARSPVDSAYLRGSGRRDSGSSLAGTTQLVPEPTRTVGFEPSCSHNDGSAAGVVLDPFAGAGTTGMVALRHNRSFVGVELNPEYAQMARDRIADHLDPLGRHMQRIGQGDLFGAA